MDAASTLFIHLVVMEKLREPRSREKEIDDRAWKKPTSLFSILTAFILV
jgi:hypothetical protein